MNGNHLWVDVKKVFETFLLIPQQESRLLSTGRLPVIKLTTPNVEITA